MAEFNTAKRNYFQAQQTMFGSLEKHTDEYEKAAFSEVTGLDYTTSIDKMLRKWFYASVGYTDAYSKNLSDLWYKYLGSKGFTGSLRDRLKKFYEDGSISLSSP